MATTGLSKSYHRPVVYSYVLGSGEVGSGYIQIYTAPYNVGNLAVVSAQIYSSGGVDKTANVKVVYTPSSLTSSGTISSGIITVTPSSPAYLDTINLGVVYL